MSDRPSGPPPGFDPYKTLQVDPEADPEVIQAAYRRLAQKFHPDRAPGDEAAARMIAINAAWEILGDPERRAALDRQRAAHRTNADAARASGASSMGGRHGAPAEATAGPAGGSGWGPVAPRTAAGSTPEPRSSTGPSSGGAPRMPESFSPDWTSGRSTAGGGYDPATMRAPDGHGAAGPPPGNPSGTVLDFGRYAGWSLGEIARRDVEYLEWLDRAPIGRAHRDEIDVLLRRLGRRRSARRGDQDQRRGLYRR